MSARFLKIPNAMTAITALVNTGIHVADKASKRASKVNVKSPPKSSPNNSKMTGGSNTYQFSIETGKDVLACTLIIRRPHEDWQTEYEYKMTIGDTIFDFQTPNAINLAIKNSMGSTIIQQIIAKISSLITQNEDSVRSSKSKWWSRTGKTQRDQEHFKGLLHLYNVLYANNLPDTHSYDSPLTNLRESRSAKARIKNWRPKFKIIPGDDLEHVSWLRPYKSTMVKGKGGSKRRHSVRRNRKRFSTRRLRR